MKIAFFKKEPGDVKVGETTHLSCLQIDYCGVNNLYFLLLKAINNIHDSSV